MPLCSDINGTQRPKAGDGPWDIGAYQGSSGGDTIPPNVSINLPQCISSTDEDCISPPVTVSANASTNSSGATIHDVQFELNGSPISGCDPTSPSSGSDTNGTYSCTWTPSGLTCNTTYDVAAIATDSNDLSDQAMAGTKISPTC